MLPPSRALSKFIFEPRDSLLSFIDAITSFDFLTDNLPYFVVLIYTILLLVVPFCILYVYAREVGFRRKPLRRDQQELINEIWERRHHDYEKNRKINEIDKIYEPTVRKRYGRHTGSTLSLDVGLEARVQKVGDEQKPCTTESLSSMNQQARNLSSNNIPANDTGNDFSTDDVEDYLPISIVERENEQPYAYTPLPNRMNNAEGRYDLQHGRRLAPSHKTDKPSANVDPFLVQSEQRPSAPLIEDFVDQWKSLETATTDTLNSTTLMGGYVPATSNVEIRKVKHTGSFSSTENDDTETLSECSSSDIFSTETRSSPDWSRPSSIASVWEDQDMKILKHDPETVQNWLDGMTTPSDAEIVSSIKGNDKHARTFVEFSMLVPSCTWVWNDQERTGHLLQAKPLLLRPPSPTPTIYVLNDEITRWFTNTQEPLGGRNRWHWPVSWYDYTNFRRSCEEAVDARSEQHVSQRISNSNRWDMIDKGVRLTPNLHQASSFELGGEVFEFINDQLDGDPEKLRSLFVVVGTEDRAWASTCLEYVRIMWPRSGEQFLGDLITLICDIMTSEKQYTCHWKLSQDLNFRVHINGSARTLRFYGYGPGHEMINFMRQLAWITSICRTPQEDCLLLSRTCLQWSGPQHQFVIKAEPLQLAPNANGSCWHSMFAGYILAHEFPIPGRDFGLGVEMPFDIMTILGLICYPINYGAGLVLKGDSTALIPSKESSDPNSIQWHFVCDGSMESTLSWDTIARRCNPEDVFCARDWKTLAGKRAFVGYFPKAELHLGAEDSGFENVKASGAPIDDKKRFNFVKELTSSFGTSGLGIFGGGLSGKVVFHRLSEKRIRGAHGMFRNKLQNAKQQPLLLFDTTTRRGWLVPELSCVLHLSLSWASHEDDPGVLAAFHKAEISTDGGSAAYLAIQTAGTNTLPGVEDEENFDKEIQVRGIVKRFLERLGQIKEQQQQLAHCTGTITDGLTGYEYVDIAQFQEHLAAKRVQLDGSSTGDWLKVMQKWPEIPVLLCSNLGDPIRPASSEAPCHHWKSVPEGSCFMTAAGSCIKYISQRAGGQGSLNIFNKLHCTSAWARRPSAPCLNGSWPCCSPLFEVSSNDNLGSFKLEDDAAIIFGKPTKELCQRFTAAAIPAGANTYDKYRARMYFHRSSADVESTCQESTVTPSLPVQP